MANSCSDVATTLLTASNGDPVVVKQYFGKVCGSAEASEKAKCLRFRDNFRLAFAFGVHALVYVRCAAKLYHMWKACATIVRMPGRGAIIDTCMRHRRKRRGRLPPASFAGVGASLRAARLRA